MTVTEQAPQAARTGPTGPRPNLFRRFGYLNPLWPAGVVATVVYVLFIGLPLVALFVSAASEEGFASSITSDMAMKALWLSAFTSTISLFITIVVGTPLAYLLARGESRLLRVIDALIELPIVLPPIVAGVAMLMAFGRNGLLGPALESIGISLPFTTGAVLFAQLFVSAPFYIRAARIGFQAVDREYENVSQTLGVAPFMTFWRLTLPLAWPAMLGGAALAWARAVSEFGATIMFAGNFIGRTQTLPLAVLSAMESSLATALAISVLATAAAVLVLLALGLAGAMGARRLQ
jgi:molybdate transport system permease protein